MCAYYLAIRDIAVPDTETAVTFPKYVLFFFSYTGYNLCKLYAVGISLLKQIFKRMHSWHAGITRVLMHLITVSRAHTHTLCLSYIWTKELVIKHSLQPLRTAKVVLLTHPPCSWRFPFIEGKAIVLDCTAFCPLTRNRRLQGNSNIFRFVSICRGVLAPTPWSRLH